jgi:cytochrome oxidase assembly protein ShyY1
MKKEKRKFLGMLLVALLLLMAIIGFYAWQLRRDKLKESAKKPVAVCGGSY